jgi:integrase
VVLPRGHPNEIVVDDGVVIRGVTTHPRADVGLDRGISILVRLSAAVMRGIRATAMWGMGSGLPGFNVRNLRHTGASLAVASGADLEHLKVRMGHESIATTSRFYLQMYEGRDAEIAKRLEELAEDPNSQRRLRGPS